MRLPFRSRGVISFSLTLAICRALTLRTAFRETERPGQTAIFLETDASFLMS
jgi:hypothetical protein